MSGSIATIAGTGSYGSSGDGGPALAATLSPSYGMAAFDRSGALLFVDGQAIRRIGTDGSITTVAGPTTGAPFVQPTGLAIDAAGDIYVADFGANRIFRMDPTGTITAVAGDGTGGSAGNGGPALDAEIGLAQVAIGPGGDLYFDDSNAYRTVDPSGTIDAFAGTGTAGFSGDGGPAAAATLGVEVLGVASGRARERLSGRPGEPPHPQGGSRRGHHHAGRHRDTRRRRRRRARDGRDP